MQQLSLLNFHFCILSFFFCSSITALVIIVVLAPTIPKAFGRNSGSLSCTAYHWGAFTSAKNTDIAFAQLILKHLAINAKTICQKKGLQLLFAYFVTQV